MNLTFDKTETADLRSMFTFFGALMNLGNKTDKPITKAKSNRRKNVPASTAKVTPDEETLTTVSIKQLVTEAFEDVMDDDWKTKAVVQATAKVKKMYEEKEGTGTCLDVPVMIDGLVNPAFLTGRSDSEIAEAIKACFAVPVDESSVEGSATVDIVTVSVILEDGSVNPEFVATHSQTETIAALNAHYDKVEAAEAIAATVASEQSSGPAIAATSFDNVLQDSVSKLATKFGNRKNKNRHNAGE